MNKWRRDFSRFIRYRKKKRSLFVLCHETLFDSPTVCFRNTFLLHSGRYFNLRPRSRHGAALRVELSLFQNRSTKEFCLSGNRQTERRTMITFRRASTLSERTRNRSVRVVLKNWISIEENLFKIRWRVEVLSTIEIGILVNFRTKQNQLNEGEAIDWPRRLKFTSGSNRNFVEVLRKFLEIRVKSFRWSILTCVEENVASLISVAFDYPNTFVSMNFTDDFRVSFVENLENFRSKQFSQQKTLRALRRTIFSIDFSRSAPNKFESILRTICTSIEDSLFYNFRENFIEFFVSDRFLIETFRIFLVESISDGKMFELKIGPNSILTRTGAFHLQAFAFLLRANFSGFKKKFSYFFVTKIQRIDFILMTFLAQTLIRRSAQILSSFIVSLADRYNEENLTIALDSFLYRSAPIYRTFIRQEIQRLRKPWITEFHFVLPTDKFYVRKVCFFFDEFSRHFVDKKTKQTDQSKTSRVLVLLGYLQTWSFLRFLYFSFPWAIDAALNSF